MKKIKAWWNKPWTNGSYVKLTVWSMIISIGYVLYYMASFGYFDKTIEKIKGKFHKEQTIMAEDPEEEKILSFGEKAAGCEDFFAEK